MLNADWTASSIYELCDLLEEALSQPTKTLPIDECIIAGVDCLDRFRSIPCLGREPKSFWEHLELASFLCCRYISRDHFFFLGGGGGEDFELFFFPIGVKKMKNQVTNEIFRQMSLTLTLPLDATVRPMEAKGSSIT